MLNFHFIISIIYFSVIVSQWTKMLDIIAIHLDKLGICYNVIQGNIPPKKRNEYVEDFNTNPKGSEVMLVSLRAGGVGLNLIGGNHLFLLDQHWWVTWCYIIQLMLALKLNIIIVHSRGVVYPESFSPRENNIPGWTIMMFTLSSGIICFIILKLYFFCITLISFDKWEHICKWTARMVPLGTPAVAILYILTSRTRFRSWSFYRYRKRFGDLDHCSPGHQ